MLSRRRLTQNGRATIFRKGYTAGSNGSPKHKVSDPVVGDGVGVAVTDRGASEIYGIPYSLDGQKLGDFLSGMGTKGRLVKGWDLLRVADGAGHMAW